MPEDTLTSVLAMPPRHASTSASVAGTGSVRTPPRKRHESALTRRPVAGAGSRRWSSSGRLHRFLMLGTVKPETDQLEGWRVAQPQRYANSRSACEFGDHLFGEQVDAGTVVGRVSEVADRVAETEVADPGKPLGDLL